MPRPASNRLYPSNAKQADLIKLCEARGLQVRSDKGKQLNNDELKRLLDAHQNTEIAHAATAVASSEQSSETVEQPKVYAGDTETIVAGPAILEAEIAEVRPGRNTSSAGSDLLELFSTSPHDESRPRNAKIKLEYTNADALAEAVPEQSTGSTTSLTEANITAASGSAAYPIAGTFSTISSDKSVSEKQIRDAVLVDAVASPTAETPYYLQLSRSKLGTYLSRGVFVPAALDPDPELQQLRSADLLTQHPNYLPLTLGRLPNFTDQDVLVKLTLRPNEVEQLTLRDSIYAYAGPIPVSRISGLIFTDVDARADAQADALTFKNYFLPQEHIAYLAADTSISVARPSDSSSDVDDVTNTISWTQRLQQFDRQLGLFGYLKHAPLLRANATRSVQDFPNEFLYALSLLNSTVSTPPPANGSEFLMRTLLRLKPSEPKTAGQMLLSALANSIYAGDEASFEWATQLLSTVAEQAESIRGLDELRETQRQIELLRSSRTNYRAALTAIARAGQGRSSQPISGVPFEAVVLLSQYPSRERKSTDKQAVLGVLGKSADDAALAASPRLEWLLSILGLYYSYSQFTREDPNLTIRDPQLAAYAQPLHRLRFNTDLFADRAVIESVFRFAMEGEPLQDPLNYLRPDSADTQMIDLPLREAGTPRQNSPTLFSSAPVRVSSTPLTTEQIKTVTSTVAQPVDQADVSHYQSALRKIIGWFSPEYFQQQLQAQFTPAEQAAIQQLLSAKK